MKIIVLLTLLCVTVTLSAQRYGYSFSLHSGTSFSQVYGIPPTEANQRREVTDIFGNLCLGFDSKFIYEPDPLSIILFTVNAGGFTHSTHLIEEGRIANIRYSTLLLGPGIILRVLPQLEVAGSVGVSFIMNSNATKKQTEDLGYNTNASISYVFNHRQQQNLSVGIAFHQTYTQYIDLSEQYMRMGSVFFQYRFIKRGL